MSLTKLNSGVLFIYGHAFENYNNLISTQMTRQQLDPRAQMRSFVTESDGDDVGPITG